MRRKKKAFYEGYLVPIEINILDEKRKISLETRHTRNCCVVATHVF